MSYLQYGREEFRIRNITGDTEAFVVSLKKYIQDFLKGTRIESYGSFDMELTVDDHLVVGRYSEEEEGQDRIFLESTQLNGDEMRELLDELEMHKDISLILEYSCFFFYFYPYGINRIGELLDKNLKSYVTYIAIEEQEDNLRGYRFQEIEGKLINGLILDQDYRDYLHVKKWKSEDLLYYLELKDELPWDEYNKVINLGEAICEKHCLKMLFEHYPPDEVDSPLANPGAIEIEPPYSNGRRVGSDLYEISEIEAIWKDLEKVNNLLKPYARSLEDRWKLVPVEKSYGKLVLRIRLDERKNLLLRVFDPNSKTINVTPYDKTGNTVDRIEKLMGEQEDFIIPYDNSILE